MIVKWPSDNELFFNVDFKDTRNKRNDKRFNNRGYSLSFLMGIFLKHLWLIPNILKWQNCKTFTKLVPSQTPSRTSHRRCSVKKIFLKIYKISPESPVLETVFLNFFKKRLQHRCFPVKIAKVLRTPILKNICERLLLPSLGFTKLDHNVFLWLSWRRQLCIIT